MTSPYSVSVDDVREGDWNELLPSFDDASVYQTWAYGAASWGERQLSHLVLRRGAEPVAAAQVRVVRLPLLGSGVAYVRWGPLLRRGGRDADSEVLERAIDALLDEYATRRGLLLRLIPICFAGDPTAERMAPLFAARGLELDPAGPIYRTFRLDLSPPLDALRKGFDPKWRNKLSGAERAGLELAEGTSDALYGEFLGVYREMMARKSFETTVDVETLGAVQQRLPEPLKMRVLVCRSEGRAVNAVVVAAHGDTGIYLLGATSDAGTKTKGSYLLHWRAIEWLKARGLRWYDLGGHDREANPGVYDFKRGFSAQEFLQPGLYARSGSRLSALVVRAGERLAAARRSRARSD